MSNEATRKRQREQRRDERAREKRRRREERRNQPPFPSAPDGVDPDLVGIVPGPQPRSDD